MRNAIAAAMAVLVIASVALVYGTPPKERPRTDESAPVIVVRHAAATPAPIHAPTPITATLPVAPPTEAASPVPQDASSPEDFGPMIAIIDKIPGSIRDARHRLLDEGRDAAWASRSEALMRTRYDRLNSFRPAGRKVDIVCGRSVCQVSGSTADRPGSRSAEVIEELRSRDLTNDLAGQGLMLEGMTLGPNDSERPLFMAYYKRTAPSPPI